MASSKLIHSCILIFALGLYFQSIPTVRSVVPPQGVSDFVGKKCRTSSAGEHSSACVQFVSDECKKVPDRGRCYRSLQYFAHGINQDPHNLACVAMALSLYRIARLHTFLRNQTSSSRENHSSGYKNVLRDCVENLSDSQGRVLDSLDQWDSPSYNRGMALSDVQTWLSAALTDMDTCMDSINEEEETGLLQLVSSPVNRAQKSLSNALAIVNNFGR